MLTSLVLTILTVASCGYFLFVVRNRLKFGVAALQPLPWDGVARRLRRVFLEVLLQTKVIRARPVTGVLHALVMWGFFRLRMGQFGAHDAGVSRA